MAPEYAMHGQFSVKSDVFSFGVLVLEIVTGRKNHSFQNGVMMEDLLSHVSFEINYYYILFVLANSSLFYIDFPCCNSFVFRHGEVGEMELHQL